AEPDRGHPGAATARTGTRGADRGEGLQDGPDADEDDHCAWSEGTDARPAGLVQHEHSREPGWGGAGRSGLLLDVGGVEAGRDGVHPPAAALPGALRRSLPQGTDQLLSPAPGP